MTYELGVIGGGNMGGSIVAGAVREGVLEAASILVADLDQAKRDAMAELGCAVTDDVAAAAACPVVLVAVKPQHFAELAETVGALPAETTVVSVMAGLSSDRLRAALGGAVRVVRAMPNTPCAVGAGMSAVAVGAGASEGDLDLPMRLLGAIGEVVVVDESQMYAVTSVSGSGPAYVFLLAESMEHAAQQVGLDPGTARVLVQQTILGAATLMRSTGDDPAALRAAVTSKKGTTHAALEVMFESHLPDIVERAITAARDRGIELDA